MKTRTKKKIIAIFKKPLVILLLFILGWALFTGLSTSFIISRLKREIIASTNDIIGNLMNKIDRGRTVAEDVGIFNKLKIKDIKFRQSYSGKEEIITGSVQNNSSRKLKKLKIKLTFFNAEGEPADIKEYEDAVKFIDAGGSGEFSVIRQLNGYEGSGSAAVNRKASQVKGIVSDFSVAE